MKTRKIFSAIAIVGFILIVAISCQKSRYCLCVSNETPIADTVIVNVDNGMNCKHVLQLGIQVQDQGSFKVDSIHHYTCTKIKKDSLSNYPNLHQQR